MKIDSQHVSSTASDSAIAQSNAATAASLETARAGRSDSSNSTDQAQLSSLSRSIQSFHSSASSRISQLTAAVQNGTYEVDPAAVSRGVVNEALASSAGK